MTTDAGIIDRETVRNVKYLTRRIQKLGIQAGLTIDALSPGPQETFSGYTERITARRKEVERLSAKIRKREERARDKMGIEFESKVSPCAWNRVFRKHRAVREYPKPYYYQRFRGHKDVRPRLKTD